MATVTELHVNGARRRINADAERPLLSVLRDDLGLTGSKYGCGEGKCGACTVLIDGQSTRSCVTRIGTLAGKQVHTIESLSTDKQLHPIQECCLECGAMQCGYCTPGMVMSAVALLRSNGHPDREQILTAMNGNICRCGTYVRIIAAIEMAAAMIKGVGQ